MGAIIKQLHLKKGEVCVWAQKNIKSILDAEGFNLNKDRLPKSN